MCGEMPVVIEMAKHHYAHACEEHNCNVATPEYDGSVCPEGESGDTPPPPPDQTSAGSVATVAAAAVAAMGPKNPSI